ncbi:YSC84-related protein [Pseudorhodoferax sp. Leaf267]|uniref:BPSL1445 family SYLF domain-containing lipoprotein n=1 Tax=Pseudorhodoferax sp. Leaf267 TaxID=1736316 RepID=UPI0006F7CF3E|nr:YSC84-related protein [Pseudorhodoferax sp. Leaf267]KQP22634.1 twin-arginine translocation pathway signal [Pseudorhodoferax sp. Leaf267]
MKHQTNKFRTLAATVMLAACSVAFVGCTTTGPGTAGTNASSRTAIDADVDAALSKLYNTVPGSRELVSKSAGVLVFPSVLSASLGLGAEYGRGALRTGGRTQGYYSTTAGSIGWQAGAQSRAVIYVFSTQDALDKFRASKGWTVGADATVALANIGANGQIDSNTVRQPVVGYVLTNAGLEAGVALQGAKISPVTL